VSTDKISVRHAGFTVVLPEDLYFDAVPYDEAYGEERPRGRRVQVHHMVFDRGFSGPPRILTYGTWYLLDGSFTKQHWGGGALIHWKDIPFPIRREITKQAGRYGVRKWWRA
jgi:hypothetical protein